MIDKRIFLVLSFIVILFSCENDSNVYYTNDILTPVNIDEQMLIINKETRDTVYGFFKSEEVGGSKVRGEYKDNKRHGLWHYFNIKSQRLDSVILYKENDRKGRLELLYDRDYSKLNNGWYLFSSSYPYGGAVQFIEYGYVENGVKKGLWEQEVDWGTFSNSPIKEKRSGVYKNGVQDNIWSIRFVFDEVYDEKSVESSQLTMNYFKTYKNGELILFEGFLIKENQQMDNLKYYSLDTCLLKTEKLKNGIKNGEDKLFSCSGGEEFGKNLIMLRNYKDGNLDGNLVIYSFGRIVYEAEYLKGEKVE